MANDNCYHACGYKGICKLTIEKTDACKLWSDKQAQDNKRERPIFGYSLAEIQRKQGGRIR